MNIMKEVEDMNFPMVLDAPGPKIWTKGHESIDIDEDDFSRSSTDGESLSMTHWQGKTTHYEKLTP